MTDAAVQALYLPLPESVPPESGALISPRRLRRVQRAKSSGAFLTIGEVAAQLGLEPHVLRFWEKRFPQINPVKRAGARRYYRPADVELIRRIQGMLYRDGYTIRGVQAALEGGGPANATAQEKETISYLKIPRKNLQKLLDELIALRALAAVER